MRVVALDFDGVISDSAPEAFWVALQTLAKLRPDCVFSDDVAEIPPVLNEIVATPLFRDFLELMPLGNRAEDFGVQLAALAEGRSIPDQPAYDRFFADQPVAFLEEFHREFYATRHRFSSGERACWEGLITSYPALIDALHARPSGVELAIATAKDGESVSLLLERYGIAPLFAPGSVVDKESGRDKRVHLQRIRDHFGVAFDRITFVDDKLNHLQRVRDLGVRCVLAAWGYNGPRERHHAEAEGLGVSGLDDLSGIFEA